MMLMLLLLSAEQPKSCRADATYATFSLRQRQVAAATLIDAASC